MRSPVSTFSTKERLEDLSEEVADVSGATAFLLQGTDGVVALEPDRGQGQKEWWWDCQPRWLLEQHSVEWKLLCKNE